MSAQPLTTVDQLLQLPLPAPVSYWPQTWGWLAVLGAALVLGAWTAWLSVRRYRRNRYRREALRILESLRLASESDPRAAQALPGLLKRVGLSSAAPADRARVGSLAGDAWIAFLRGGADVFPADAGPLLRTLAYGPPGALRDIPPASLRQLFAASRQWMERHHVAA